MRDTVLLATLALGVSIQCVCGASLDITIAPKAAGEAVQPGALRYQNSAGESFSITRLSFLLADFALQRVDGSWLELTNEVAWFDFERNRLSHRIGGIPNGQYRNIRFFVGPDKNLNHINPARFSADHPLNPNLNGLHWSWQGGYNFLALEGMWRNAAGALDGWSYHLARDANRVCVTIPVALSLTDDTTLALDLDLATLLNAPRPIVFSQGGSSTHSRDADPIASALVLNLPGALQLQQIKPRAPESLTVAKAKPLYLPGKFTPYRFKMSSTFPMPDLPADNPLIEERVALGEKLFSDTALSRNGAISCASCHHSGQAFTDPQKLSVGVEGRTGTRNSMPLFNLAWKSAFFWDGRASSLREQALMPVQDHAEMDESLSNVVAKLSTNNNYVTAFKTAFGSTEITSERIGLAIESFVLTLTSFDSKFDRVMKGEARFSDAEQRGFELFTTEFDPRRELFGADCFHCHGGALFQSQTFANNGLDSKFKDAGRSKVTGKASDLGKFATPSLRNVAVTAPYMHDGRFATLEEVIEHYSSGVKRSATLDPNLAKHPDEGVHLSDADKHALVVFLKTLTDPRWESADLAISLK